MGDLTSCNFTSPPISTHSDSTFLWVPDPTFRGTTGIISLCLTTTIVCVWNSLHMDIPTEPLSWASSQLQGFVWATIALLFPDLLFFHASIQRAIAGRLLEAASRKLNGSEKEKELRVSKSRLDTSEEVLNSPADEARTLRVLSRRHPFTLVHAFYATMGGYVVGFQHEDGEFEGLTFLPAGQTRVRITTLGLRFLMEYDPDIIPDHSQKSITDRSQTGSLSKALLIVQVARFCLSCISRLVQNLPLSLLEVTTAAHGLYTLASYVAWWSKPQNIDEPTLIRGERAREACALMMMLSFDDLRVSLRNTFRHLDDAGASVDHNHANESLESQPNHAGSYIQIDSHANILLLAMNAMRRYGIDAETLEVLMKDADRAEDLPYYVFETNTSSLKWFYLILRRKFRAMKSHSGSDEDDKLFASLIQSSMVIGTLMSVYGSVHFLAWNAQFPSSTERLLWRIACIFATTSGAGPYLFRAVSVTFSPRMEFTLGLLITVVSQLVLVYYWPLVVYMAYLDQSRIQEEAKLTRSTSEMVRDTLRQIFRDLFLVINPLVVERRLYLFRKLYAFLALYIMIPLLPSTMFILVESIRQLFFLPCQAYVMSSWYTYFQTL